MKALLKDVIRIIRVWMIRAIVSRKVMRQLPARAVVMAPHPDDEVFGCCGLMQRMLAAGRQVDLVIMTGGGRSHSQCCRISEEELMAHRRNLTRTAASIYGLPEEHIHFLDYPDGGIDRNHPETSRLDECLRTLLDGNEEISVFYPHSRGEGWPDHRQTGEIAKSLCASLPVRTILYEYCVWFWFYNCWSIDWGKAAVLRLNRQEYAVKRKAVDAYTDPLAPCGKPWSGVLPAVFLWASRWDKELYFKVK